MWSDFVNEYVQGKIIDLRWQGNRAMHALHYTEIYFLLEKRKNVSRLAKKTAHKC